METEETEKFSVVEKNKACLSAGFHVTFSDGRTPLDI